MGWSRREIQVNHAASTVSRPGPSRAHRPVVFDDALRQYGWLVHTIAARLVRRMPPNVEFDDLKSAGVVGLLDAAQRFNASQGGSFRAYADLRIRGAIMDELRILDWVPRSVRRRESRMARAERDVRDRRGRQGTDAELCAELQVDVEALQALRAKAQIGTLVRAGSMGTDGDFFDSLPDPEACDAEALSVRQGERDLVQQAMALLTAREQSILRKSFFENMRLRDIGGELSLTESRISQLRTQAMANLRRAVVRLRGQGAEVVVGVAR